MSSTPNKALGKTESLSEYEYRLKQEAIKTAEENKNRKIDKYDLKR